MSLQDELVASTQLPQVKEKPRSVLDSDDDTAAEQDAFEDAVDATDVADTTSIRSLTKRSTSTTLTRPTLPDEDEDGDEKEDHPLKEDLEEDEVDEEDKAVTEHTEPTEPAEPTAETEETQEEQKTEEKDEHDKPDKANAHEDKSSSPDTVGEESSPEPRRDSTSPSERLSSDSNLDNVNLDDETIPPPQPLPKDAVTPAKKNPEASKSISLTSVFPSMPWSPPSAETSKAAAATPQAPLNPSPAPAATARKLTSPFSWLSRNSSKDKEKEREKEREREKEKDKDKGKDRDKEKEKAGSAGATDRRNTASSINSNPEMMLSRLEEEKRNAPGGDKLSRESLKDRFKVLRMQQEASAPPALLSTSTDEKTLGAKVGGEDAALADVPPTSPVPPPNSSLAPGTASGINAGPSALTESSQVDWDLWQSVVYEGPAAVARSSAEELNTAIATGIPNAIRGVIWQVLAQSKNEDLEVVYRDLVARGTEKDKNRHSNSTATSSFSNANLSVQSVQSGEGVASSASSIKSDNSVGSSAKAEKNSEAVAKAQAAVVAERRRKEKEDAANLVKLEKVIRRDLGARTSYSKYAAAAGLQDGLFGVCKAYALFDEGVGYAQGMNFLIMPLLFNMPEQEVFCLLVRLMNHYGLRDLFIQDMPGLHMHLYQFERLLEDLEPALYCHLHRKGISPHLYATQWFLTLFAYRFPLQLVLRIYDMILSEGLSAIIRFGIVLMQKNTTTLLGLSDMQQLTTYLKDKLFDVYIDKDPSQGSLLENGFFGSSSSSMDKEVYRADQLVHDACEVKISPEILKTYQAEWEEKTKVEKGRETELSDLRSSSQSLGQQVRKLEERVEVADREQASLATELVHTKVENDELKDEVEALRAQVTDLKAVIEKQPLEIEEIWKLERDDLMKRNEKVHLENEKVEKELLELEEELVQTKLRYAEIYAQHEALTRKWTDVKRQFA